VSEQEQYIVQILRRLESLERSATASRVPSIGNWHDWEIELTWAVPAPSQLPQYAQDNSGMVHLRGVIEQSSSGTFIGTLPAGYRPAKTHLILCSNTTGDVAYLEITPQGLVTVTCNGTIGCIGLACVFPKSDTPWGQSAALGDNYHVFTDALPTDRYGWPHLHKHANGCMIGSGLARGGTGLLQEPIAALDTDQCDQFQHALPTIGGDGGSLSYTRVDSRPGKITYSAGITSAFFSFSGLVWPSSFLKAASSEAPALTAALLPWYTSSVGNILFSNPVMNKDYQGWVIMSGLATVPASLAPGTRLFTIADETMRPPHNVLSNVMINDTAYPIAIYTNGDVLLQNAYTVSTWTYLSFDGVHFHTT